MRWLVAVRDQRLGVAPQLLVADVHLVALDQPEQLLPRHVEGERDGVRDPQPPSTGRGDRRVEDLLLVVELHVRQPAVRRHHALGPTRRARGVDDVRRVLKTVGLPRTDAPDSPASSLWTAGSSSRTVAGRHRSSVAGTAGRCVTHATAAGRRPASATAGRPGGPAPAADTPHRSAAPRTAQRPCPPTAVAPSATTCSGPAPRAISSRAMRLTRGVQFGVRERCVPRRPAPTRPAYGSPVRPADRRWSPRDPGPGSRPTRPAAPRARRAAADRGSRPVR